MPTANSRKRKQPQRARGVQPVAEDREVPPLDPALFIQAHEADIVRGPQAHAMALSLEVTTYEDKGVIRVRAGDGLIPWHGGANQGSHGFEGDEEEVVSLGRTHTQEKQRLEEEDAMWVDRYDARLLLDSLPTASLDEPADEPSSPGGWSDLPSDAEDTFFFSPDEAEDYRREKRRRLIDHGREARLRALRAEEAEGEQPAAERWGGSDEEPDEPQRELMRRTATHVLSSPNPAQLEMRILANHGADSRFAFLKGRWARAWRLTKAHAQLERAKQPQAKAGLGGLAGYGGSESESSGSEANQASDAPKDEGAQAEDTNDTLPSESPPAIADDEIKAARRARAKEWAQKRRLAQAASAEGA